jgi:hypothetical protein
MILHHDFFPPSMRFLACTRGVTDKAGSWY